MNKFLLIWGIIFISIIFNLNYVSAASWYYTDWPYRQMILINNSAPTPDDYQVKIVFDPSNIDYSKTNDDGSDLRFTYYHNGSEEEVNYWIEVWNETGESIVWIKAPKIEGIYYVYYGNENTTDMSDGENTFEFFDDFRNANLSKWVRVDGSWDVVSFGDNYVLKATGSVCSRLDIRTNYICNDCAIEAKLMIYKNNQSVGYLTSRGDANMQNHYASFYYGGTPELPEQYHQLQKVESDGTPVVMASSSAKIDVDKWYDVSLVLNGTFIKSTVSGNGLNDSIKVIDDTYSSGYVGLEMWSVGNTYEVYFDDFRVRKYSFPEPSYEIGGVETKEPPELIDTDVENLYEGSIDDLLREFFTARYIRVLLTAWISHDDLVGSVKSNFSAEDGIVIPDNFPMGKVEGGEYSLVYEVASAVEIVQKAVGFLVSYLTSGTELNLLEFQPEVRWKYVIVNATYGDSRPYLVDKRLPSILEWLPKKFTGRATMFMSACPVDMLVTDPEGRRTGSLYENGEFERVVNEIERSVYTGRGVEPEFVVIFDPKEGGYGIEVHGNGTGTYNFSVISVDNGSVFYRKDYTNVPIEEGETHTYEEPVTDIEPPEAVIGYDPVSEELVVEGKDNFDGNVSVSYDEGCSKRLFGFCLEMERDYTLTDDAGNSLVLSIGYNKIQHANRRGGFSFIHARLLRAKYVTGEGSKEYEYARNLLSYRINKKSGKTEHFSQDFYMKGRGVIRTRYEPKKNETRVWGKWEGKPRREVLEGFKVLKITTDLDEFVKIDV